MKKVLTIAGSDSSGGAGIQADIKTMSSLGVYGMSIITAITAQNTMGVFDVLEVSKEMIESQINCIFQDISVDAVKIGMVSNTEIIKVIKEKLIRYNGENIVVDPVMVSKSGYFLLKQDAVEELKDLISIADIVTPNIPEAEVLSGIGIKNEEDMKRAAEIIAEIGAKNILIKGGHRCNNANDILYNRENFFVFEGDRIETKNTHGTGCTLSSAIASYIAKGYKVEKAIELSKQYINKAIKNSFSIGQGVGPVGHFIDLYKKAGMDY
ncbi:hydroxymethylpyrimidine/phosphomethylpyrimidine kinase [Clostridium pasteurianum DSM 525 = ATCC 6013]|uniref:Hydroxymethylpyrimidine/phosphomethylpyrimidine kinase n=1 Tax=Clostridium pasteurianum DSM 525 = ATCC 6013 TaxID=1262449 RepID=A0A0H3J0P5_CLOPA|nr:bifunctional hydroxymethylpyrimidine kinase/phosphomethylpyrimidine kinase [Clostridium pasteurianum]AJA46242.1 hydroxymethylpyrimidine/phosphomethylpyrimidine kinase [Clostridium pasteurianum DSM 525 = ATCC 6013]AJA50230.1 hydroxymethylpyrimidine/phosphomethylpyrimidine kinase [Clostridium pasteurianum DSM 525 = ATCC 6013]AOZ73695.1 phosphomethylpyrimidine kinase [Clostridium pasteurianum DSM 525 = ATCC 6013]AOZ77492.1 phosphomethylpyrimidine kinase [Clostridium pasteurianum]ELP60826.1 pho